MGPSPLEDQRVGGALMWGMGEVVTLIALLGVLVAWANADQKEARRVDRRLAQARAAGTSGSTSATASSRRRTHPRRAVRLK